MEETVTKKEFNLNRIIFNVAYIYIAIPIILFFIFWSKWYVAVPLTILIAFGLFKICRNDFNDNQIKIDKTNIKVIITGFLVVAAWVYLSGIGGLVYQNSDHIVRNGLFDLLVDNSWPAIKEIELDGYVADRGIIYYIAFWIPAALVGKVLGYEAGYFFQTIWAVIGVFLFFYLLCLFVKKVSLKPLLIFIFFSGLDIVGTYILAPTTQFVDRTAHIEWWSGFFQFSSFTTQLFWVFNQAMPLWLVTMLVLLQKNNKQTVLLMGLSVLYGPFPFLGLVPICIASMLGRKYEGAEGFKGWFIALLKDTITIENVLCGGAVGIISYIYFRGNAAAQLLDAASPTEDRKGYFFMYLFFFMLEAGVYFIAVAKSAYKDKYFYVSLVSLMIIPFVKIGYGGDFCMRVSIPPLLILCTLFIKALYEYWEKGEKLRFAVLLVIFFIGAVTPVHEFNRTLNETKNRYFNSGSIYRDTMDEDTIFGSDNFSGETDESLFFNWLAR